MTQNLILPETGFLRLRQVLKFFPISKSKWYQGIADGIYPPPVKLGPRVSAYRSQDIKSLIERLSQEVI